VNVGAVATPDAFVLTVAVFVGPGNVPLAPDAGAVNVTEKLGITTPPASFTTAAMFVANAVFTVAVCGVPATGVIVAGT
jgi:hypothetical protein